MFQHGQGLKADQMVISQPVAVSSITEGLYRMSTKPFEVVIVGGGCAGLSAAIGLAKLGVPVAVVEAAVYPGAENWSGCVYFCENLVQPELLGRDGMAQLAWERRLVRRGAMVGNGHGLFGVSFDDPDCFRHCYTVLRPVFDHHLAELAQQQGVVLFNQTTAESFIRDGKRIIGVATQRGPLYGKLVFLAEGDASHLVSREGYERIPLDQKQPKFLHGIKQVMRMPAAALERNFDLKPGEGAAYEIILRNAKLHGRSLHLNMGGFIYTNHSSLSMGLVLPAEHLHDHFAGDPHLLLEWFEHLPDLRSWFRDGERDVFGAKLIRGGGPREFPQMVDHGLAIGGAATGLGVDFPYPNYTGPATRMGLELVRAVRRIRELKGSYSASELHEHYLTPLKKTRYWRDAEFLRDWPGYVESTKFFFDQQVDLILGAVQTLTAKDATEHDKLTQAARWLSMDGFADEAHSSISADLKHLEQALPIKKVFQRPPWPLLLVEGWLHLVGQLTGLKKADTARGQVRYHISFQGDDTVGKQLPAAVQILMDRFKPGLAMAAWEIYGNDDTPLPQKINRSLQKLTRHLPWDALFRLGWKVLPTFWKVMKERWSLTNRTSQRSAASENTGVDALVQPDLTPWVASAHQKWEDRLGKLGYFPDRRSHIHVLWPWQLTDKGKVTEAGLWHVCPAHVYEARTNPLGQLQIVVNHENCIKCETCWRTSDLVDWGRDGLHRFIYAVQTPAAVKLIAARESQDYQEPRLPEAELNGFIASPPNPDPIMGGHPHDAMPRGGKVSSLIDALDQQLTHFAASLGAEPRTIDTARADYLHRLAKWLHHTAVRLRHAFEDADGLQVSINSQEPPSKWMDWLSDLVQRMEQMQTRIKEKRFAWAASECRHVQQHHLHHLKAHIRSSTSDATAHASTSGSEFNEVVIRIRRRAQTALLPWKERLDEVWGPYLWRELDLGHPLTPPQNDALAESLGLIPPIDTLNLEESLHPAIRKEILAELGRRDPSLGYRLAHHLWVRDAIALFGGSSLQMTFESLQQRRQWSALIMVEDAATGANPLRGEALMLPLVDAYLICVGDRLYWQTREELGDRLQPLSGLGLRGTPLCRIDLDGISLPSEHVSVDAKTLQTVARLLQQTDLLALGLGMAEQLTLRCTQHAASRVQFPGLFHDERSRDTIGKFGAVKKMLAEMGAHRLMIETLCYRLSPRNWHAATQHRLTLAKAIAALCLGTAPGSLSYNAGQIFGGTGYSEDDILSKYYRDAAAWRFLACDSHRAMFDHGRNLQNASLVEHEPDLTRSIQGDPFIESAWREIDKEAERLTAALDQDLAAFPELAGWIDAALYTSKLWLARLHDELLAGSDAEMTWAFWQVWWSRTQRWLNAQWLKVETNQRQVQAFTTANGYQAITDYRQFLSTPMKVLAKASSSTDPNDPAAKKALAYNTGDYLISPLDPRLPRYTPEMIETDKTLSATDQRFHELIVQHFGSVREGLCFERYIEAKHLPDDADLDFCRQHGFFRMPIAPQLGGEGKLKAEYYSLVMQMNQYADATMSLLIQANSSIGTSPILFARDKDLPKAKKDLAPFVKDEAFHAQVILLLDALEQRIAQGDVAGAQNTFKELQGKIDPCLKSSTLKPCLQAFSEVWKQVSRAVPVGDLKKAGKAKSLAAAWKQGLSTAQELDAELDLRLKACDLALRWISSGQISAFALTEPSAGSDTARVATRAKLVSVPVEADRDGVMTFQLPDGGGQRVILDAAHLIFQPHGVFYRYREGAEPAKICFDEYDYETDDPRRQRYYLHGERKVYFSDAAFLRRRNGQTWYDYWEMTGAKMWITNGRMSGIMSLYAKTSQGVTGFVVDRHAEGFIVGKDEAKMGQNGSPTNEIALQAVRVPRENVLGLEGRGQVNALETLNVGRAGLAMTSVSQMRTLILLGQEHLERHPGSTDHAAWHLNRVREETWIAESLAFMVIGQFEHPTTQSVRMESAIAKMLVSELLHSSIEHTEVILGLASQSQQHLVEKRKRDARIINIYEGTNEVQRFLLVKELVGDVLPRWKEATPAVSNDPSSQRLVDLLSGLRDELSEAAGAFGQGLWQNPNLQPTVFWLAEASAWLLAAQAVAGRLAWLHGCSQPLNHPPSTETGQNALSRCLHEIQLRLSWFRAEWQDVKRGCYAPVVRAADLMFDDLQHGTALEEFHHPNRIEQPLHVLVLLEPHLASVPQPATLDGRLLETYWSLSEADAAALETALRLRDAAPNQVRLTAAMIGGQGLVPLLREVAARGLKPVLLQAPSEGVSPVAAAEALAKSLADRHWDLLLGPADAKDRADGMLTPLTACAFKKPFGGSAARLAVWHDRETSQIKLPQSGSKPLIRNLPCAVTLEPGIALRPFTTDGYLEGLTMAIERLPWPQGVVATDLQWTMAQSKSPATSETSMAQRLDPPAAADWLTQALGIRGERADLSHPIEFAKKSMSGLCHIRDVRCLAVIACDLEGRLTHAGLSAARAALAADASTAVLLLAPIQESAQEKAIQTLLALGLRHLHVMQHAMLNEAEAMRSRVLLEAWPSFDREPWLIVAERWAELALAQRRWMAANAVALTVRAKRLTVGAEFVGVETSRHAGKLLARENWPRQDSKPLWLSVTDDVELDSSAAASSDSHGEPAVCIWSPNLDRLFGQQDMVRLIEELKNATGSLRLSDAEFIIDVGYGVGNRDGYEAVIEPLEKSLLGLGVKQLHVGGSRKVTEELHILPMDRQIGQSGVSVNPKILLAIGISGAPQHLQYIGPRAHIISFNKDPEAPMMTLNQRQPRPIVFPVVGDLFQTVPAFIQALKHDSNHGA